MFSFLLGLALIAVYKTFDNIGSVFSGISLFFKALRPFVIGFVIAYLLDSPTKRCAIYFSKAKNQFIQKHQKGISIFLIYLIATAFLYIAFSLLIPTIYSNIIDFTNNLIPFTQNAIRTLEEFQNRYSLSFFEINEDIVKKAIQQFVETLDINHFTKYAQGAFGITSGVLNTFIGIIISVYMLLEKQQILSLYRRILNAFFSEKQIKSIDYYTSNTNEIFSKFIYCRVIDAIIIAILSSIILLLLKVKYALVFGLFIGVCNLIPYFGSIASGVVTTAFTIFSGGWLQGLWTGLALLILQQIDGNLIGPKIMGDRLDASPLLIILAVTLGGALFGFFGMLLSVPIAVVVKLIFMNYIASKEQKKEEQA